MNIFLAKIENMYYLIAGLSIKVFRRPAAFLILSLFFLTVNSHSFADVFDQSAEDYRIRGYEEQQKGRFDRALTFYLKAISLGQSNAVVYNDIGVTYEQLGLEEKAQESYLKAIQVDPEYLPPYTNLAYLYKNQNKIDEAVKYFRERYSRAGDGDPWKERIAGELQQLDPGYKEELVRRAMEAEKEEKARQRQDEFQLQIVRAEKHYQKGLTCLDSGDFLQATEEFDRALALTPNNPRVLKAQRYIVYLQEIETVKNLTREAMQEVEAGHLESAKRIYQDLLTHIPSEPVFKP